MTSRTSVNQGSVLKYILLPGILPRIGKLLGGGFKNLPYFITAVFNTLGIIPNGHPYLLAANHGKYSTLQALSAASANLTFDRKNIDKVTIFFVVIAGLVLMALQFILCIMALFTTNAFAQGYDGPKGGPVETSGFFENPNHSDDLAFRMLDLIFGVPDIFKSKDMITTPFHKGLQALFEFYSFGILMVGTLVIIYLVTRIVLETAQSGVPFGERFNHAWAPVRLILFFGLLLPATHGLNLAQYLVLQSAKMGSNVATNAWLGFDEAVTSSAYLGEPEEMIAEPNTPSLSSFVTFMQIAKTCQYAYGRIYSRDIQPYVVFGKGEPYQLTPSKSPPFTDLAKRADGGTLFIRFGEKNAVRHKEEKGKVFPFCGELTLSIVDQAQPGATLMQQAYLDLINCLWQGQDMSDDVMQDMPSSFCSSTLAKQRAINYLDRYSSITNNSYADMATTEAVWAKTGEIRTAAIFAENAVKKAREKQIAEGDWMNDSALKLGWAGAGIWFNKIAEQNGALTTAAYAKPEISKMPSVMEFIRITKLKEDSDTPLSALYTPNLASGKTIGFTPPQDRDIAVILNQVFAYWSSDNNSYFVKSIPETQEALTGNIIIDVMNVFMGTRGLFDMCKNTDIHPLAQLTSLGKGLVEHSIRGFALAAGTGIGGGILGIFEQVGFKQVLQSASSFFVSFAGLGLLLGFILYYVIPFMPFIYFFFAVMTWVKSIFEAMVGMPLWALAHLHIDGEGMPGEAATAGYFHILEIFLRPVLILIGLLGGIAIFAAMVKVMNQVFYLVLSNLAGHYVSGDTGCFVPPGSEPTEVMTENMFVSGTIDEFFYTVIYTIIVYLFAQPCFKLVDMIPDHAMTWLGSGISTFGSQDGDPAEGLMKYTSLGAARVGQGLQGGFQSAMNFFK